MVMVLNGWWNDPDLEGNIEGAAYKFPKPRGKGLADWDPAIHLPRLYFQEKVKEALELGIAPPADDTPLAMMEYETRMTILREMKSIRYRTFAIPNPDI